MYATSFELPYAPADIDREYERANLQRWKGALAVAEQEADSLREWLERPTVNEQGKRDRERELARVETRIIWLRGKVEQVKAAMGID